MAGPNGRAPRWGHSTIDHLPSTIYHPGDPSAKEADRLRHLVDDSLIGVELLFRRDADHVEQRTVLHRRDIEDDPLAAAGGLGDVAEQRAQSRTTSKRALGWIAGARELGIRLSERCQHFLRRLFKAVVLVA